MRILIGLFFALQSLVVFSANARWQVLQIEARGAQALVPIEGIASGGVQISGDIAFHCVLENTQAVAGFVLRVEEPKRIARFDFSAFTGDKASMGGKRATHFRVLSDRGEILLDFRQNGLLIRDVNNPIDTFQFGFSSKWKEASGLQNLIKSMQDDAKLIEVSIEDAEGDQLMFGIPTKGAKQSLKTALTSCLSS